VMIRLRAPLLDNDDGLEHGLMDRTIALQHVVFSWGAFARFNISDVS
jgi:hypothetical protein